MELRDYAALPDSVQNFLRKESWAEFIKEMQAIKAQDSIREGWDLPLRPGVLREGMARLLHLEDITGLDVDFLRAFADLKGNSLQELAQQARPLAINHLRNQVEKGNTFFMDTELMKESDQAVIVPNIIEARTKEIETLGQSPSLADVYSTYYGFSVLTSGGLAHDRGGIAEGTRERLMSILGSLGDVSEIPSKQLKFSYLSFRSCSSHLKVLLWNLLRMCVGGDKAQRAGVDILGELGDTRATELMHLRLDEASSDAIRRYIVRALGRIGAPESLPFLENQYNRSRYYYSKLKEDTLIAIGGIRSHLVHDILKQKVSGRNYGYMRTAELKAIGNTLDPQWISIVEEIKRGSGSHRRRSYDMEREAEIALRKLRAT